MVAKVGHMFRFSIDRGGTFTDVYAECPSGKVRVLKLLSDDPQNYQDAPTEAIRRILEEVYVYSAIIPAEMSMYSQRTETVHSDES